MAIQSKRFNLLDLKWIYYLLTGQTCYVSVLLCSWECCIQRCKHHWGKSQVNHSCRLVSDCHFDGSHLDACSSKLQQISFNLSWSSPSPQQFSTRPQMASSLFGLDEDNLGNSQASECLCGKNCSPVSTFHAIEPMPLLKIVYGKVLPHEWVSQVTERHMASLTCWGYDLALHEFPHNHQSWLRDLRDKPYGNHWPGHCTIIEFSINTKANEEGKYIPHSSDHNRTLVNPGKWERYTHPQAAQNQNNITW